MKNFKKVINPCKIKIGKQFGEVYVNIEFEDGRLSLSGVEAPLSSGNCRGSCGQIEMDYSRETGHLKNAPFLDTKLHFSKAQWLGVLKIWDRWHLNDIKAGTSKQEFALREWGKTHEYDYKLACEYLKSINLYNDKGYKYGTAWLKEEVPEHVLEFLYNLPETTKHPAWV